MLFLVAGVLFVFLFLTVAAFGHRYYVKPSGVVRQLGGRFAAAPDTFVLPGSAGKPDFAARWLASLSTILPVSPKELGFTKRMLIRAGYRKDYSVAVFYGIRIAATVTLLALAFVTRYSITDNPVFRIVVIAAGGALGFFGPGFVLESMIKRRSQRIGLSLPDVLDLLVVCTESGCALDLSIVKVSKELALVHPDVCEELSLIGLEMLAGSGRAEALRNFAMRTGDSEAKKLVAVLVQTDRFGTSVSEALRTQSDFLRIRRRQEAEERAGKVGVKLVFPIFFFCLPSLFIVTAGPGILQLVKNLFPVMKEFK